MDICNIAIILRKNGIRVEICVLGLAVTKTIKKKDFKKLCLKLFTLTCLSFYELVVNVVKDWVFL